MNIQSKKNESKINLLKEHINHLIEYNNIIDYNNVKDYSIYIKYIKENNGYNYNIDIFRGKNYPKKSLTIRMFSGERIDDLIRDLANSLSNSMYFDYISYKNTDQFGKEFILNFKNKVSVYYPIRNKDDEILCNKISDDVLTKHSSFITNTNHLVGKTKDELQEEKAKLTIKKIRNIFNNLIKLNNIESYENIKPFKLIITNSYDNLKKCNVFNFKIVRGMNHNEVITDYSFSIFNINSVINELMNLIYDYVNCEEFVYYSINTYNDKNTYNINLKNMLQIQFNITYFKDIEFFDKIFEEMELKNREIEFTNVLKLLNKSN